MAESESAAVPLGDTPKEMIFGIQIKYKIKPPKGGRLVAMTGIEPVTSAL